MWGCSLTSVLLFPCITFCKSVFFLCFLRESFLSQSLFLADSPKLFLLKKKYFKMKRYFKIKNRSWQVLVLPNICLWLSIFWTPPECEMNFFSWKRLAGFGSIKCFSQRRLGIAETLKIHKSVSGFSSLGKDK